MLYGYIMVANNILNNASISMLYNGTQCQSNMYFATRRAAPAGARVRAARAAAEEEGREQGPPIFPRRPARWRASAKCR